MLKRPPERESKIEKKVKAYAREKGWLVYKFSSPNQRGVPDNIFMKDGKMFFIEFKIPGAKMSKLQIHESVKILRAGFETFTIDSIVNGELLINSKEEK